jgi:hypothetical protein
MPISSLRTVRFTVRLANLLAFAPAAAVCAPSAQSLLNQGLHFADLYNWYAARPYFEQARRMFEATGDKRNALYAHCGAIRAGAEPAPITEISDRLGQELARNPLLQSDRQLRVFCLAIKGDFDGEIDSAAMRRDWEEVRALAGELGSAKWRHRARGQLGFADFYDGDVAGAQRNVAAALVGATETKDIGAQIFFLSTIAAAYQNQGMEAQAGGFADRAIALASANPDAGYPIVAHDMRLRALLNTGQTQTARSELAKILVRPELRPSSVDCPFRFHLPRPTLPRRRPPLKPLTQTFMPASKLLRKKPVSGNRNAGPYSNLPKEHPSP